MRRLSLLAAALLILFTGCRHEFKTDFYEDEVMVPLTEEGADSLYFTVSLEYVTGGVREEVRDRINAVLVTLAFDMEGAQLESTAADYRDELIDEYLNEYSDEEQLTGGRSWEESIDGLFMPRYKQWKNYTLSIYSNRGAGDGIFTTTYLVFDEKTGAQATEEAFFRDGFQEGVAEILRASLREDLTYNAELLELVDLDRVAPNGNFCVDTEGMDWVFQPYELGPYVGTQMNAQASWEELKPYLK